MKERKSILDPRRWMRKRRVGREIMGAKGKERRTWFMRPVSGIIERRMDAAEGWGWGVGKNREGQRKRLMKEKRRETEERGFLGLPESGEWCLFLKPSWCLSPQERNDKIRQDPYLCTQQNYFFFNCLKPSLCHVLILCLCSSVSAHKMCHIQMWILHIVQTILSVNTTGQRLQNLLRSGSN